MNRFRTLLVAALASFGFILASTANAEPKPGVEYRLINPPQPVSGKGVEVLEFFNYACPHCYEFEPVLKAWLKNKPKDVEFRYVPAVFNERMLPLAKLYYTLEQMGLLDTMHDKVYVAIHQQGQELTDRDSILKWIGKQQGVDAKKFESTFDSFSIDGKAQRSAQLTRNYRIPGTPYVVVNGRYLTGPGMALGANGNVDSRRFVQVLNDLVEMGRRGAR